jgi:predicted nucleic acid-binding protein
MRVCLDTSAYSAFMRGHEGVVDCLQRADEIALTTIVLGELLAGFRRGGRSAANRAELARFRASSRVITLTLDEETALRYAEILTFLRQAGTPIPTNDLWIAASAMQHGLHVVTTDSHFAKVPQVMTELFEP